MRQSKRFGHLEGVGYCLSPGSSEAWVEEKVHSDSFTLQQHGEMLVRVGMVMMTLLCRCDRRVGLQPRPLDAARRCCSSVRQHVESDLPLLGACASSRGAIASELRAVVWTGSKRVE